MDGMLVHRSNPISSRFPDSTSLLEPVHLYSCVNNDWSLYIIVVNMQTKSLIRNTYISWIQRLRFLSGA